MVAAGILLSRIVGLVRNRVFAHYFGTSDAADAFNAAFRIPNFLQNLFGEGCALRLLHSGLRQAPGARRRRTRPGAVAGAVAACCARDVGAGAAGRAAHAVADRRSSRRASRARSASSPSGWSGSSSPAPGCWCCRPGASACSTATAASSSPTRRRCSGTWRSSRALLAFGERDAGDIGWPRSPPGARWWAARCSSASSCPTVLRLLGGMRPRSRRGSAQVADGDAQFRPGLRRPRRGPDQRLRRHGAREPAARPARSPGCPTLRCSTRCR